MPKGKYECTRGDARQLERDVSVGDELWVIVEMSKKVAPYEDDQMVVRHKVTHFSRFWGKHMVSGTVSVGDLLAREGPVYLQRPAGLRAMHEPSPQVADPLDGIVQGVEEAGWLEITSRMAAKLAASDLAELKRCQRAARRTIEKGTRASNSDARDLQKQHEKATKILAKIH